MEKNFDTPEFRKERDRVAKALSHATAEAEKRFLKARQDYMEAKTLGDMPAIEIKEKYPDMWTGLLRLEQSIQDKEAKKQEAKNAPSLPT